MDNTNSHHEILCMKKLLFILFIFLNNLALYSQSVAINTDGSAANASSILDIKSTTKGLLIPRMTTAQRTAIATPAKGLIVFDITTGSFWFHDGMAWEVLSTGSSSNYWSLNGSDIYNNAAGNVGIGTTTPTAKLHVAGDVKINNNNPIEFGADVTKELNAGKIGYQTFTPGAMDIVGAGTTGTNRKIKFWNEGGAEFTGNLGVGVSDPLYSMDIAGRIRIRSGSGGITNAAGVWLNNPANSASIAFIGVKDVDVAGIYGNVSGWGLVMNTNTGGVGIGYQNPVAGYRLSVLGNQHIEGLITTSGDAEIGGEAQVTGNLIVGGRIGLGGTPYVPIEIYPSVVFPNGYDNGWTKYGNSFGDARICLRAAGNIIAQTFDAFSDSRIKNIVGVSNTANDLITINALQVTDYRMKDKIMYGNKSFKKVIAQEVERVYPQVVSKNTGCIPNVYAVPAKIEKTPNGYLLSFTEKHNLSKTAKKIQLRVDHDTKQFDIVSMPSENQVEIKAADLKTDKVFVYGEEVDDLRTVDYEGLTTLNISATQELSKLIKKQHLIIETQQQQIDLLLKRVEAVEKK